MLKTVCLSSPLIFSPWFHEIRMIPADTVLNNLICSIVCGISELHAAHLDWLDHSKLCPYKQCLFHLLHRLSTPLSSPSLPFRPGSCKYIQAVQTPEESYSPLCPFPPLLPIPNPLPTQTLLLMLKQAKEIFRWSIGLFWTTLSTQLGTGKSNYCECESPWRGCCEHLVRPAHQAWQKAWFTPSLF